jgi:hypothetical protein
MAASVDCIVYISFGYIFPFWQHQYDRIPFKAIVAIHLPTCIRRRGATTAMMSTLVRPNPGTTPHAEVDSAPSGARPPAWPPAGDDNSTTRPPADDETDDRSPKGTAIGEGRSSDIFGADSI